MRKSYWTGIAIGGAVGVVLASAGALWAQAKGGGSGRVIAVDVVKVFAEYQRQKDLSEEMKNKNDQLQKENQTRREAIETLQTTVERMNPDDPLYTSKMRDVLQMQIEYKNWFDLNQADMAREVGVWTAKIYKEIVAGAGDMAQREGIDLVVFKDEFEPKTYDVEAIRQQISNRKILYASGSADYSPQLIEKLNTVYRAQPRTNMLQVSPVSSAPPVAPPAAAPAGGNAAAKKKP